MNERLTTLPSQRPAKVKSPDPTHIFVQRDRLPWIWFGIAAGILVISGIERGHLVAQIKKQEHVVIIDPAHTYHISPLLQFEEATELHVEQATLATLALLQRSPKEFDHLDWLKKFYLKTALEKAQSLKTKEAPEFRAKQLHQKPEIGKIDILGTRENEVLARVSGQLIRSGIFEDRAFAEAFPFTLRLRLVRNPNLATNGRYPTAVTDFTYEISP